MSEVRAHYPKDYDYIFNLHLLGEVLSGEAPVMEVGRYILGPQDISHFRVSLN